MQAIQDYGTPSRMRGDRGGENAAVSVWMIMHQGPNRASFMWGSWVLFLIIGSLHSPCPRSTHNTRIERLWVEVGTQFVRCWQGFFTWLGHLHSLDRKNPSHLWPFHRLFLEDINNDCHDFQDQWNLHPMSGRQAKDRSPTVRKCSLFCIQMLTYGVWLRIYVFLENYHTE
jgi:hypothetical protein